MLKYTPEDGGWIFDEYDSESFWVRVGFNGGRDYQFDPLVDTNKVVGDCWIWLGAHDDNLNGKYGNYTFQGKKHRAHRLAYRDFGKTLPEDRSIDHLCRNTLCVNPNHLEAVTHAENVRRGRRMLVNAGKCKRGHPAIPENLVQRSNGDSVVSRCKLCLREHSRATYRRLKNETT